ncbi:DHA2 family efflux MFS transporter permease subunit [Corynebacterium caspium]|uniref:DHA2 family efflux MFS transporter permease subunit n=1 Tax=Corynebacterium caspium TaxID=234828 RepID=UPI00036A10B7|nr:DHA2 family efflux MFS transporter permease subunit [Corynebacterium caspium]WKD58704.1 putative multidrug resistance protein EmrY [Corynebacterium caspium DSM 44850]
MSREPVASPRVGVQLGILVLATMVMILNETTFSVALPAIMEEFSLGAEIVQWLSTVFLLTLSVVIPTTGYLIERFPTRKLFGAAVFFFILGSALGALAPAFWVLFIARIIQACGTALIIPLMVTVTLTIVDPARRGFMMGINSVVISVAPALGPTLAGFILHLGSWHWLLIIMVILAVLIGIAGWKGLGNTGETRVLPLDFPSLVLCAVSFGCIVYALTTMGTIITAGSWIPALVFILGLAILAIFVRRQIRLQQNDMAFLDMRPFKSRNFTVSVIMIFLTMGVILGTVNLMPIYLSNGLGLSSLVIGMMLFPGGLTQGVLAPIVGRLYDSFGPRPLVIPGAILMVISQLLLFWDASTITKIVVALVMLNVGAGLVNPPINTVSLGSLPQSLMSHGSASLNSLQQLGAAAGTAALIGALTLTAGGTTEGASPAAISQGATAAFVVAAIMCVGLVICAPLLTRLPAIETKTDTAA